MHRLRSTLYLLLLLLIVKNVAAQEPPSGDAMIRAKAGGSEIVITTTSRLAGAIHSLTWNGKEFIDSFDHGRQLQSASNFDCGKDFIPEVFNPTEAGSVRDGAGPKSSSKLLKIRAEGNTLETTNQMAFWLTPRDKSLGHAARNDKILSDHLLTKKVRIGYKHLPQAIEYEVVFHVPGGEQHKYVQFEALTGYMPAEFNRFWKFNPETKQLETLDPGPGEQSFPVILATDDRQYAMGVYSPGQPSNGFAAAGYGRFLFATEKVVKWNCVFRVKNPQSIPAGDYRYRMFVVVGTLHEARATLADLVSQFAKTSNAKP